ncbi:N-acetylglucosamine-6-phosphate deacetylase [Gilvimarinus sp. SDUM040013]|uniref:N-acetylglucosamine-6-phosphate deacetylase n=1 Tax=Gilvimarinus gilvus TaxID=3058038 RepID=A0ABU4RSB1_9GAMM|nr:N-acetylglucosamine-6-phosphate deacetylase [Gilvimarinus sp. SDUM040013]MDO3388220.1 N-acetylglucosamine-6-phosphate deacetylase [Gilvimarinus sp. SDUM040013]MDX6847770.1 N-acetylglucosamine-6-phosphate deacetylase [Gilvimarinus sp. SDUM040013]
MKQALVGARIFTGDQFLDNRAVVIEGANIISLPENDNVVQSYPDAEIIELDGGIIAPGFIDLQVNGGGGAFFTNDTSVSALQSMLDGHRPTGTTSMLPTLISDTRTTHQAGVKAVADAVDARMQGILGIHIEGPFFDMDKRGAHNAKYIREIEDEDMQWLTAIEGFKIMVTLAPEHAASGQIKRLVDSGIFVAAGHTNAHYEDVMLAIDEGLSGFTHLFNAMRPQTGREPGVVGAALDSANTWCGIICDNHHVHPGSVRVAMNAKPLGKLYLVTDAMSTVGGEQKSFTIYGEEIFEKDGALVNAEGNLAGSAIGMIDAVRIAHQAIGISLSECLRMASLYPAQYMRLNQSLGRIDDNYRADLVHFTNDFNVTATWVAGDYKQH